MPRYRTSHSGSRLGPPSGTRPGAVHPGRFLASVLEDLDATVSQSARDLDVSRQALHRIIKGDAPITPELAVGLEELSGTAAEVWLLLQVAYDLSEVRHRPRDRRRSAA